MLDAAAPPHKFHAQGSSFFPRMSLAAVLGLAFWGKPLRGNVGNLRTGLQTQQDMTDRHKMRYTNVLTYAANRRSTKAEPV